VINILLNDNILFEANLKDSAGVAITTAVGSLTVTDFGGSAVLATHAAHTAAGTYQFNKNTAGWGYGPVTERWTFTSSSGTSSELVHRNFRIVGTTTVIPYIFPEELQNYHENIGDYFDGNEEAQVFDAFYDINSRLEALGIKLPIAPRPDGFYDQALRDLNAYEAIIRIVSKRQQSFDRTGNQEPWFMAYRKEADRIYKGIANKMYNFDRDISTSEGGVGIATKVVGGTRGQMETNWRGGVGKGFKDDSFERDWIVKVTGTGTAGEIAECTYTWSNDGGISIGGTLTTAMDWNELGTGVYVRFHRGTYTGGTVNLFAANDTWNFKTFPKTQTVGGVRTARSY
jgi:hypothetical protein